MTAGYYLSLPEAVTKYALLQVNGKCVDTMCTTLILPWPYAYSPTSLKSVRLTADGTTSVESNAAAHFFFSARQHTNLSIHALTSTDN